MSAPKDPQGHRSSGRQAEALHGQRTSTFASPRASRRLLPRPGENPAGRGALAPVAGKPDHPLRTGAPGPTPSPCMCPRTPYVGAIGRPRSSPRSNADIQLSQLSEPEMGSATGGVKGWGENYFGGARGRKRLTKGCRRRNIPSVACTVEYTDEFGRWWATLDEDQQEDIAAHVALLEERDVRLGHPHSSAINGSRHGHMRELRIQSGGRPLRAFYAFDPRRMAILLIGRQQDRR